MKLLYAEDEAAMSEAVVDMELYLGKSKWSRNIKEQTRRLGGLMQDLLTLARMDEGAAPAQKAALSLSGLAEQALEPFLQPMEAQGITLERDIQPEVSLTADPAQLEQLLSLLLDNAVKYTGPGGRIRLSVKQEGSGPGSAWKTPAPSCPRCRRKSCSTAFTGGTPPAPRRRAAMALAWRWPAPWPRQTRAACTPSTFRPKPSGLWRNSPTEHAKPKDGPQPAARLFFF